MAENKEHIIPYRTFIYILALLITLTFTSLLLTRIYLGVLTAIAALLIAVLKSSFVLRYFMHTKFDIRMFSYMAAAVAVLISTVIIVTLLDYIYR